MEATATGARSSFAAFFRIKQRVSCKNGGLAAPRGNALALLAFALSCLTALAATPSSAATTVINGTRIFQVETGKTGQDIRLAADFLRWNTGDWRFREVRKGVYRLTLPEPWVHSFEYKLSIDGRWQFDPTNPVRSPDGYGGFNSLVEETAFEEDPMLEPGAGSAPLERTTFKAADYEGIDRSIVVLSPAGTRARGAAGGAVFSNGADRSVTIYFQDGTDYLDLAKVANLLANLARTNRQLPKITGVFIPPRNRMDEYGAGSEHSIAYGDFLANRLVPEIERRFPSTGGSPEKRMLMGASLGGLISFYTGLRHPEVFGKIAAQSGSFWWEDGTALEWLTDLPGAGLNQKFFIEVGSYETADMRLWNRRLNGLAQSRRLDWNYREYPSMHSWTSWRNQMGEAIQTLLGGADFFSVRP